MIDLGVVNPGETILIPVNTFDGATGASEAWSGIAVTDIEVYKGTSMTQRASDSGYVLLDTDGIDLDGVVGIGGFTIDLADNTTGGFWAAGSRYYVVVASVTVDAQTVNFVPVTFKIGWPAAIHNTTIATLASQTSFTLSTGSADDDAYNGCPIMVQDVDSVNDVCIGFVSDYTGSTKTVTLIADPAIFTMAATDHVAIYMRVDVGAVRGVQTNATNLASAAAAYSATRGLSGTALPAAAADAAGGLIISDAGGLDADAQIVTKVNSILEDTGTTLDGRIPAALVGGRIDANMGAISSDATAADNAEAFFDGTGYAGTGNVIPTVTAVTGLTAATVHADLDDIQARLPAALVSGRMASIAQVISTDAVDAAALNADAVTEIQTAIESLLATSTRAELAAVPAANASLAAKLTWLAMLARNKMTNDGTSQILKADDTTTTVATSTVGESGGTVTRGEYA